MTKAEQQKASFSTTHALTLAKISTKVERRRNMDFGPSRVVFCSSFRLYRSSKADGQGGQECRGVSWRLFLRTLQSYRRRASSIRTHTTPGGTRNT